MNNTEATLPPVAQIDPAYPECEGLLPHRKQICRCEGGLPIDGPHGVNAYRALWGISLLPVPEQVQAASPLHGQLTASPSLRGIGDVVANAIKTVTFGAVKPCGGCKQRQAFLNRILPFNKMKWAYGVTTVKQRLNDGLLARTLNSLKQAGFEMPRLFIDGDNRGFERFGLPMTHRAQRIQPFGNWYLALLELTIREPHAVRYAIFQDDIVVCRSLREYLSAIEHPKDGYLNLITYPENQKLANGREGFYHSNKRGLGAQALVFTNEQARLLLRQQHMTDKPMSATRGHRAIDGGVVDAFRKAGFHEYVHNPSLVWHTGRVSSMGNSVQPAATSFRGEDWDALSLLQKDRKSG